MIHLLQFLQFFHFKCLNYVVNVWKESLFLCFFGSRGRFRFSSSVENFFKSIYIWQYPILFYGFSQAYFWYENFLVYLPFFFLNAMRKAISPDSTIAFEIFSLLEKFSFELSEKNHDPLWKFLEAVYSWIVLRKWSVSVDFID